jgi:hypothetical protein
MLLGFKIAGALLFAAVFALGSLSKLPDATSLLFI